MSNKNIIYLFTILIFLSLKASGQYSTRIEFFQSPSSNTVVGSFVRNDLLYVSLNDLAYVLNLKTYVNNEAKKIEVKTKSYKIILSAENSYVVITDTNEKVSVLQLQQKIYFAANSFFIPIKSFFQIFNKFLDEEITYDLKRKTIVVGKPIVVPKHDIFDISYEPKANGTLIRLHSRKNLTDYDSWIRYEQNDTEKNRGWLYITVANAKANLDALTKVKPSGIIKELLMFPSPTSVQFTFKLNGAVSNTEIIKAHDNNDLLITIYTPTEQQLAEKKEKHYEKNLQQQRDRWKLDVVVIDPGHGGKDPGAIGVTGTKEKDVTLAVAFKLGKLLEKNMPDVKVIYTRKSDKFVELYKRGQIANQANGKLFISLHCNAAVRKQHTVKGFEVYLLRRGKTEHALRIAERENSVIQYEEGYENRYQELTEENFILLAMAQSAYLKYSERFAEISTQQVGKFTDLEIQGVKQAGFFVLVGASMPNVLVEMGYLSNRSDEKLLKSSVGQNKIALALFNAIQIYKNEYEQSLDEGKTMGAKE